MTSTTEHTPDKSASQKAQGKRRSRHNTRRSPARQERDVACDDAPQHGKDTVKSPPSRKPVSPLAAYRARMQFVGRLLNTAVESLEKTEDGVDAVGSGAYLCLMGEVFEALDGLSQALPLDDLVKLSKVVTEQRRAELSARKLAAADGEPAQKRKPAGEAAELAQRKLPPNFGDVVRQIYGTSLANDVNPEGRDCGGSPGQEAGSGAGL